jgi:hypothetical protein
MWIVLKRVLLKSDFDFVLTLQQGLVLYSVAQQENYSSASYIDLVGLCVGT